MYSFLDRIAQYLLQNIIKRDNQENSKALISPLNIENKQAINYRYSLNYAYVCTEYLIDQ